MSYPLYLKYRNWVAWCNSCCVKSLNFFFRIMSLQQKNRLVHSMYHAGNTLLKGQISFQIFLLVTHFTNMTRLHLLTNKTLKKINSRCADEMFGHCVLGIFKMLFPTLICAWLFFLITLLMLLMLFLLDVLISFLQMSQIQPSRGKSCMNHSPMYPLTQYMRVTLKSCCR